MNYQVWYHFDDEEEQAYVCVSFLRDNYSGKKVLYLRFRNDWDKLEDKLGKSTKDWLNIVNSLGFSDKYLELHSSEDGIYLTFDLTKVSYEWMLSIVSLVRLAGEYTNIIYNFWWLKEKYPLMKDWDAIFAAHQLKICPHSFFNTGHTLFTMGSTRFDTFSFDEVKKTLDKYPPYNKQEYYEDYVQAIWHEISYGSLLDVNKPWFETLFGTKTPYFLEEEKKCA